MLRAYPQAALPAGLPPAPGGLLDWSVVPGPARHPRRPRALAALAVLPALLLPAPAGATRALTWNIAGGPNNARAAAGLPFDLAAVERVIARAAPDVVGLQEACGWQAAAIGADLGYTVWHAAAITGFSDPRPGSGGSCDYGNALLARPPLALEARLSTPLLDPAACKADARRPGGPECRVLQTAVLQPGAIAVGNTHAGVDATAAAQRGRVVDVAATLSAPTVLLGDANAGPDRPGLAPRLAALGFLDAAGALPGLPCADVVGCALSFPSGGAFGAPKARADYVWHRGLRARAGGTGAAPGSGRVDTSVDGVPASDHVALLGDLRPAQGPAGGLAVRPRALRNLRRHGLPVSVGTRGPATVTVTLTASPATARRLRLPRARLGSATTRTPRAGAVRLLVRPAREVGTALRRASSARLAVAVTLTGPGGRRTRLPTRIVTVRQAAAPSAPAGTRATAAGRGPG